MSKAIEWYRSLKDSVKASLWFTICNFMQKGIAMLTLPIFTRLLSTSEYGIYTVYQSWLQIITIIVTFNLSGAVVNNGLVKYNNRKNEFISSIQTLTTVITFLFFILYCTCSSFWERTLGLSSILILTMFITLFFEPAYLFWMQKNRFEIKYRAIILVTIIISIVSPLLGVLAVTSTEYYKAEARIISYALVQICIGLACYIIQAVRGKRFFDREIWKFVLTFNLPLIPHYLSQVVLGQADRIMINSMVGGDKTAIYGVVYSFAAMMTLLINAINSSFIPTMYHSLRDRREREIKDSSTILCTFMGAMVSLLMLIGPEVILIFSTREYLEAIWLIPPISASVYFTYIYTLFVNIEFYYEKTMYTMMVSLIGAGLNIFLNYVFILLWGYIAAGYTTLFCYILFAVGHFMLAGRACAGKNKIENIFDKNRIITISICVSAFCGAVNLLYRFNYVRYLIILMAAVLVFYNRELIIGKVKMAIRKQA